MSAVFEPDFGVSPFFPIKIFPFFVSFLSLSNMLINPTGVFLRLKEAMWP